MLYSKFATLTNVKNVNLAKERFRYWIHELVLFLNFRENIRDMIASLLACGIDPDKAILFQQSSVSIIFNITPHYLYGVNMNSNNHAAAATLCGCLLQILFCHFDRNYNSCNFCFYINFLGHCPESWQKQ